MLSRTLDRTRLFPYEDLRIIRDETQEQNISLTTPWLTLEASGKNIPSSALQRIADAINLHDFENKEDLRLVQFFLQQFTSYPIFYISSGAQGNLIDPLSSFTVWRREHLLKLSKRGTIDPVFEKLKSLRPASEFRKAAALIIRQNHYVTLNCNRALQPALARAGNSLATLKAFITSELGHDTFFEKAMLELGFAPSEVDVLPETVQMIEILEQAANESFLALATIIDLFEQPAATNHYPLADILAARGFEQASMQLRLHRGINVSHQHSNTSVELLLPQEPITIQEAELAEHLYAEASRRFIRFSEALNTTLTY